MLVQKYRDERGDDDDVELLATITRAVDASPSMCDKKDLIESIVDSVSPRGEVDDEWRAFIRAKRTVEFDGIIEDE